MRRLVRIALRAAAATLAVGAVAALLALALAVALSRGLARERLRADLETRLTRALAGATMEPAVVRVGALDGPLLPDFVLRDVRLQAGGASPVRIDVVRVRFDLRALVRARRLVIESLEVEGLELALARGRDGRVGLAGLELAPRAAGGTAGVARPEPPVAIELRALSLEAPRVVLALAPDTELAGRAALRAQGLWWPSGGPPAWPLDAALDVTIDPSRVAGRGLDGAHASLRLAGAHLWLDHAALESAFGRARVRGEAELGEWLDPTRAGVARLDVRLDALEPGVLLDRPELSGALTGRATLDVDVPPGARLAAASASLSLSLDRSQLGPLRIDRAQVDGRYAHGRFELAQATVDGSARLRARGRGDLETIERLELDADAPDLAPLAELARHLGAPAPELAGAAHLRGRLAGPYARPTGALAIEVTRLAIAREPLGGLRAEARLGPEGRVRIAPLALEGPALVARADGPVELRLLDGGVAIDRLRVRVDGAGLATARGRITADGVGDVRVTLSGVDLATLPPLLRARLEPGLAGRIDAELAADGPFPAPRVTARLEWREPRVRDVRVARLEAELSAAPRTAVLRARLSTWTRELATAELQAPWDGTLEPAALFAREATQLVVRADDLDAAVLRAFWPEAPAGLDGTADLLFQLRGGSPRPAVSADLRIEEGAFEAPFLGQRLGPLTAHVTLQDDVVRIEEARLEGGAGEALLAGRVDLHDLAPVGGALRLELRAFELRRAPEFSGFLDGVVTVDGPLDALAARGEVVLSGAKLRLVQQRDPLFKEIRVRQLADAPAGSIRELPRELPPLLDGASLDLRLRIPRDTWIEGQGANVEIEGVVDARKRPFERPYLVGVVGSVRGSYRIYGKSFTLERGRVVFTPRSGLDPDLDVAAVHRVRDVNVRAIVGGTVEKPSLRLESEPPYPENDLLALLLFGRTTDELAQNQTGALSVLLAQTAGAAAIQGLGSAVGPTLPIENLVVTSSSEEGHPSLGVGHFLTQDVYLQYDQALDDEGESRVRLDWRLGRRFSIESHVSGDGNSSADLIWSYDY